MFVTALMTIYVIVGVALAGLMAYTIARQKGMNKYLWGVLTILFGTIPLAYVFWAQPKS